MIPKDYPFPRNREERELTTTPLPDHTEAPLVFRIITGKSPSLKIARPVHRKNNSISR